MKKKRQVAAAWNLHPGEILREDFLKPLEMSSYSLATRLRVPASTTSFSKSVGSLRTQRFGWSGSLAHLRSSG
jgi:hypothetical protein